MHALDILGDPVRRRLVEVLAEARGRAEGRVGAGELTRLAHEEFGISQPAVSNHLRVLRDAGFATSEPRGSRRLYALVPDALEEVDDWLQDQRRFWTQRFDALDTEIARGRTAPGPPTDPPTAPAPGDRR